ncbi:MAG TPA: type VI secretion system contractile sheath small subunit [Saprospiraceae bacterium]|nr:type VI secretion system contractile sheath small subunit [Saprospiraceae bacterium]HPI06226.1 type VI secretion system contractile sheath small subunit [Saprospiraceae bacterium]
MPDPEGGRVVPATVGARVEIAQKCALIAVETPNAPLKPEPVKATNIDDALQQLGVSFKVQLRNLDGEPSKETIDIRSLDDFEEATIVEHSTVLSEQNLRMNFLREIQDQLCNNKIFREDLKALLASEKRTFFLEFLQGRIGDLKKPAPGLSDPFSTSFTR